MFRPLSTLLTGILVLGIATTASAGIDVVINFDEDTDGVAVPHGTVINSLYAPWGVTFSRTLDGTCGGGSDVFASSNCLFAPAPLSAPNVVSLCGPMTCTDISENAHGLVVASFNSPADIVCIEFVAVSPGMKGVLRAYDEDHALITSDTNATDVEALCVTGSGIKSVEFSGEGSNFGWFDNMRISYQVVGVEPSTWSGVKARF